MADGRDISHRLLDTQRRVFRVACDPLRYGLTLKIISIDSGIPDSTLRGYASGHVAMPMSALVMLFPVLPSELLSAFLPEGFAIVRTDTADHDQMAALCLDFAMTHTAARNPDSEWGVDIGPEEDSALSGRIAQLRAKTGG